jgi:hypothetical protein
MRSGTLTASLWLACVWIHAGAQQYTFQRSIGRAPQAGDPTALAVVNDASNARIQVFSVPRPQSHHHPTQPGNPSLPVSLGAAHELC